MDKKICRLCEHDLPVTDFNKNRRVPDKLQDACKGCNLSKRIDAGSTKEELTKKIEFYIEKYINNPITGSYDI